MYLKISIFLILITIILTYTKKLAELRKNKPDFFNFILTLVATFVGVFLAIEFTNKAEFRSEEENVIKILDATSIELNTHLNKAISTFEFANLGKDSTYSVPNHLDNNPIGKSKLFNNLTQNEIILRHISSLGLQNYSFCYERSNTLRNVVNDKSSIDKEIRLSTLQLYISNIEYAKNILAVERLRITDRIDEKETKIWYEKYRSKATGINNLNTE